LPSDHPDKHREIGSEPTPAAFLDTLYGLSADWGRLLPEWASICVELGDTMSGSGGAGGDYNADGLREGQQRWRQQSHRGETTNSTRYDEHLPTIVSGGPGWPLAKSMCLLPHAYTIGLAYGHNPLTGAPSPAGQWRIRNVITWARPNPPVGSLGKRNPAKRTGDYKFRPACSFITVACRGTGRYFDLDAVRTEPATGDRVMRQNPRERAPEDGRGSIFVDGLCVNNPAGAPPLDWHTDQLDGDWLWKLSTPHQRPPQRRQTIIRRNDPRRPLLSFITVACRGTGRYFDLDAVRVAPGVEVTGGSHAPTANDRASARVGFRPAVNVTANPAGAPPLDWHTDHLDGDWLWKLATAPYPGSHYATYPLTVPRRLIQAMCPSRVCVVCGWPSERVTEIANGTGRITDRHPTDRGKNDGEANAWRAATGDTCTVNTTLGWTDCGCSDDTPQAYLFGRWRTGHVLDPFGGSGTTAVAAALDGRDATLIDLDPRNVDLVRRRLLDHCRIIDERRDGNTVVWTVEPASSTTREAIASGQLDLFAEGMA
jgi:hypothetical protein